MNKYIAGAVATIALFGAAAVEAKWTELAPGRPVAVAKSRLTVAPAARWNMSSTRTSKKGETWSFDGPLLNRLDFYGALGAGEPLIKETNKKRDPLPKFAATMLPTDVAEMFERTNRIAGSAADFAIDTVTPADFAGAKGFRFTYHYTGGDDTLTRKGLAAGAVIGGKLYLITYSAPAVHYFDAGLSDAQAMMDSAKVQ